MAAKNWTRSKQWIVGHKCDRCSRAAANGVFYEPDEVRHRRNEHDKRGKLIDREAEYYHEVMNRPDRHRRR